MSPTQIELGVPSKTTPKANEEEKKKFNIKEFFEEVKSEFYKISWPSKDQVTTEFIAVLILVVVLSGIIYGLDLLFGYISDLFLGRI